MHTAVRFGQKKLRRRQPFYMRQEYEAGGVNLSGLL